MSAGNSICFFGVRIDLDREAMELVETRVHPLVRLARANKLHAYYGDMNRPHERYQLFIGHLFANLGLEGSAEVSLTAEELSRTMSETTERLCAAGIPDEPRMWFQHEPDC